MSGEFIVLYQMPGQQHTPSLMEIALDAGVSFAPGEMFSAAGKYKYCLRLN